MSDVKLSLPYLHGFLFAVSPFSPDSTFMPDALTGLEAGMGVKIVSVLASHVSELASLSALPEPVRRTSEGVDFSVVCSPRFCSPYIEASAEGHQWSRSARAEGAD